LHKKSIIQVIYFLLRLRPKGIPSLVSLSLARNGCMMDASKDVLIGPVRKKDGSKDMLYTLCVVCGSNIPCLGGREYTAASSSISPVASSSTVTTIVNIPRVYVYSWTTIA
jgi:hypothetical protein